MNANDLDIAKEWSQSGFVRFSRMLSRHLAGSGSHVVELSDLAWACAGLERKYRATRTQRRQIVQESLQHHESVSISAPSVADLRRGAGADGPAPTVDAAAGTDR